MWKVIYSILAFSVPVFWSYKLIQSFFGAKDFINNEKIEVFYSFIVIDLSSIYLLCLGGLIETGEPLERYENSSEFLNSYTPLSFNHILIFAVFFILGLLVYFILLNFNGKMAPLIYVISCSILLVNIVFNITYFIHTFKVKDLDMSSSYVVKALGRYLVYLSMMYMNILKQSMDKVRNEEKDFNKDYKNKIINKLYKIFIRYETNFGFWILLMFPVLMLIQLFLVLFGQKPDSFIQVFLDTSSYNYSKVIPPDPIIIPGDGHYLCTVAARGHKNVVKPLRSGIRHGRRVTVNRQLMVANAFENILEQYTPKLHKFIRYIYDKYGYPLSNHINTKFSADIVYILMKPLEFVFLIILYCVDVKPENRINIQYSELRK
ncbi:MAG: hypothetical protein MJ191_03520 [Clostridium sp.]|nr:hypothetical protein [Clostridium sp.]